MEAHLGQEGIAMWLDLSCENVQWYRIVGGFFLVFRMGMAP